MKVTVTSGHLAGVCRAADPGSAVRQTPSDQGGRSVATMTTTSRLSTILAALAAAGGAAWLAKLAVVAATDGATSDTGAAAIFYLLGVALLAIGSTAVGLWLAAGRHRAVRVLAVVLSPVLFFVSFMLLDSIAKLLVGDAGPAWLEDEAGIGLTAMFWLLTGLLLAKPTTRVRADMASA